MDLLQAAGRRPESDSDQEAAGARRERAHGSTPLVLGLVLAGGSSSRMGRDKALLERGGESLVAAAVRRLEAAVGDVVLADAGRRYLPGWTSVADGPGRGPAAGLLGAAAAFPGRPLLALACDLPWIPVSLLAHLAASSADWTVPATQRGLEPLCALYRPQALELVARRVAAGRFDLHGLAEEAGIEVRVIAPAELATFGPPERLFANWNRPEDMTG
ncbi:MAG TPA: molybdenum cofactor guanylyltransferase [Thermoanaerobaculia bacterium]|nr:molybdenum cofactor guanylyltransferase [Thermoanaerobaculia bacterium]